MIMAQIDLSTSAKRAAYAKWLSGAPGTPKEISDGLPKHLLAKELVRRTP